MRQSIKEIVEMSAHIAIALAVIISSTALYFYYTVAKVQNERLQASTFRAASERMHAAFKRPHDPTDKESVDNWNMEVLAACDYFVFLIKHHELDADTRLYYERDMATSFRWIKENDPQLINFVMTDPEGENYEHLRNYFTYLSEKNNPDWVPTKASLGFFP
ncbi:MAG: hypothetical protein V3V94_01285 [Candidatus Brocadiales bacterium]